MNKKKKRNIILVCLTIITILFVFAFDVSLKTRYYKISSKKIKSDIKIAFISDLHSCYYGKEQKNLLNRIYEEKPDVILFGGDIADDVIPHKNTEIVLKYVTQKYPCYYVSGNHEYWSNEIDEIKNMFRKYGVVVLEGQNKIVSLNGEAINICGVDDPEVGEDEFLKQINNVSNQIDNSMFTVFLTHRPERINTYKLYDFDLILAGHAHGGQWRIPKILNGLYAPNQGIFPKYAGGLYTFDDKAFIVSRGLSRESTFIPRIFNPPELVIIDIEPSK